jgi:hypothetical protein
METIVEYIPVIAIAAVLGLFLVVFRALTSSAWQDRRLKERSEVLANASVFVHSIRPTDPPDIPPDDEEGVERRYYSVDVTITPAAAVPGVGSSKPRRWEPFALDTTDPDSDPHALDEPCELVDMEVWRGNGFVDEDALSAEETEVEGAQRVRLRVGVYPGVRRFVFDYYAQEFGEVRLPSA